MPTYRYRCDFCKQEFEEFQLITATGANCSQCGAFCVERIITGGSGLNFKGSGFYETDYKRKNQK